MDATMSAFRLARLLDGWQQADGSARPETGGSAGPEAGGATASRAVGSAADRLAMVLESLVLDGRLVVGARLPSERDLAREVRVGRPTVAAAYARMRERGFLTSRRGAGSWTSLPATGRRPIGGLLPTDDLGGDVIDLAVACPAGTPEPILAAFRRASELLAGELCRAGHGYHAMGLTVLRDAIAARYAQRGLPTTAEQILITGGAQSAAHLVMHRLLGPRDVVLVEQPTYPNGIDALRRTGARIVPVAVTVDGWDVEQVCATLAQTRPRAAYLIVDFHNPTGALLADADRERIVHAASRYGTTLIVDETHAELTLEGEEQRAMASFDRDGHVVTIGSFSKTFWGGLRLGWVRAAPTLINELAVERSAVDLGVPVVEQLAATQLLAGAEDYVSVRRSELAERRDALLDALAEHLPAWQTNRPSGGMSLWVTLDAPVSTALAAGAEQHGLRLAAGPRFGLDGTLERYLRIPFVLPPEDLQEAVRRLAALRSDITSAAPRNVRSAIVA